MLKNGPSSITFAFIFGFFKQTMRNLQQINVKNVHPVSGTGIRTHNPLIMSLLDPGFRVFQMLLNITPILCGNICPKSTNAVNFLPKFSAYLVSKVYANEIFSHTITFL